MPRIPSSKSTRPRQLASDPLHLCCLVTTCNKWFKNASGQTKHMRTYHHADHWDAAATNHLPQNLEQNDILEVDEGSYQHFGEDMDIEVDEDQEEHPAFEIEAHEHAHGYDQEVAGDDIEPSLLNVLAEDNGDEEEGPSYPEYPEEEIPQHLPDMHEYADMDPEDLIRVYHDILDVLGNMKWESFDLKYSGDLPDHDVPSWITASYEVWFRNPHTVVRNMLANPDFKDEIDYAPVQEFYGGERRLKDFMSGDWAWKQAVGQNSEDPAMHGSAFIPVILGSDKTTVSVATGQTEYYPLYLSIGNVHNNIILSKRFLLASCKAGVPNICTADKTDLDGSEAGCHSHDHTEALVSNFELGVLWDEYGLVGDIVQFDTLSSLSPLRTWQSPFDGLASIPDLVEFTVLDIGLSGIMHGKWVLVDVQVALGRILSAFRVHHAGDDDVMDHESSGMEQIMPTSAGSSRRATSCLAIPHTC
ncbi:hypothetical protein A0H81_08076 [Grifola frondosa]|uniref:C2H2-type domain-containing protein n=1 Tax=Grifola frondosa TaxID=5627 RepID=A0A1C7M548_GRIFR|nr:hypothetical protein A0H81_08076 [Grifola frondosa]